MPPSISRAGAGCLHHGARAGAAGKFRTFGHDHPELRGDHIQPLRGVLADHRHGSRRQHGQAVSSGASVTSIRGRCAGRAPRLARRLAALSRRSSASRFSASGIAFGDRLLQSLEAQLQLVLGQTLGAGAELHAPEVAAACDATGHSVPAGCPAQ